MVFSTTETSRTGGGSVFALIGALVAAELVTLSLLYQHGFEFTCRDVLPTAFCAGLGRAVPRALGIVAALSLFAVARRDRIGPLWQTPDPRRGIWLHLVGFVAILGPLAFLSDDSGAAGVAFGVLLWLGGLALTVAGLGLMIASRATWSGALKGQGSMLMALVAAGALLPEIADLLMPLWRVAWVTNVTFAAVNWALQGFGYATYVDPSIKLIGSEDFSVRVGPQCSGIEGFVLISVFLTLYMTLFRRELRFPHVLLLFPVGLLASWAFNIIRIVVLLMIGIEGAPDLAIGGFHSHAGWLTFTLLSVGLIALSRLVPTLSRNPALPQDLPPFLGDPAVAQILPFIVFMASGLLASTFFAAPATAYPLRVLAMVAALVLVWPWFRALPWRLDGVALASGAAVAVLWIATAAPPEPGATSPLAGMGAIAVAVWIGTRVVGTTFLVPMIEEALFRGYLMDRLAPSRRIGAMLMAIVVTSVLFAALHDRWLVAGLAGLVFGALMLRSGNLTDAIVSHATANGAIAAWAIGTGDWHIL